jgi:hypothetical protein
MRSLLLVLIALPLAAENYGGAIPIGMSVAPGVTGCGQITTGSCAPVTPKPMSTVRPPTPAAPAKTVAPVRNQNSGNLFSRTFHKALFFHHDQ